MISLKELLDFQGGANMIKSCGWCKFHFISSVTQHVAVVDGKAVYFCSDNCKQFFMENAESVKQSQAVCVVTEDLMGW